MSNENEKHQRKEKSSEAEEVREILEAVADNLPKILESFSTLLFSGKSGEELGKAVGSFYKSLIEAGIPPEKASIMTEQYMNSATSVSRVLQKAMDAVGSTNKSDKKIVIEGSEDNRGLTISMGGEEKHLKKPVLPTPPDIPSIPMPPDKSPEDLEKQAKELMEKARRMRESKTENASD